MRITKPPFFQAQWGDVITNTPYHKPNLEAFTLWWLEFKDIKGLEDYDIWLVGSFCEKMFGHYKGIPKDIDVVLTGEIKDEEQLNYILSHGIKAGFNNKVLIDLKWATGLTMYNKWEPVCSIRIAKTFTTILGDRVNVMEYHAEEEYKLDSGLWQFCYQEPPDAWFKSYNRWEEGHYEGLVADVRQMFE